MANAPLAFVRAAWKSFLAHQGHDGRCLAGLEIERVDWRRGGIGARLGLERGHTNRLGSVHGGLLATIVDSCGSLAINSTGLWLSGVSTEIHVCFMKPAGTVGQAIDIEARVDKIGRTLAYTSVLIKDPETGEILARGSHTKYIAKVFDHEKNVKFSEKE